MVLIITNKLGKHSNKSYFIGSLSRLEEISSQNRNQCDNEDDLFCWLTDISKRQEELLLIPLRWKNHYTALRVEQSSYGIDAIIFDPHRNGHLGYSEPPIDVVKRVFPSVRFFDSPCMQINPHDTFCVVWTIRFLSGVFSLSDTFEQTFVFLKDSIHIPIDQRQDFIHFLRTEHSLLLRKAYMIHSTLQNLTHNTYVKLFQMAD